MRQLFFWEERVQAVMREEGEGRSKTDIVDGMGWQVQGGQRNEKPRSRQRGFQAGDEGDDRRRMTMD